MKKALLISLFIFTIVIIFGILCFPEKKKDFPSNQIIVLSSFEDSLYSESIVYSFFKKRNRFLPIEEDFYDIKWISPKLFNDYKDYPALIVIKNKSPKDETGDLLFDRVFKNKEKGSKVNIIENIYSDNQMIVGIESEDTLDLRAILNEYSESIYKVDDKIESLIFNKYTRIPENEMIVNQIFEKYGINVFIDHEYQVIKNKKDILWIGRGMPSLGDPYRWIIIREIDKYSDLKGRISVIQDTFKEVMSDSNSLVISGENERESYEYVYNNNYIIGGIYILSEIIKNDDGKSITPSAGGPYVSYILNREFGKDILLIGLVNSPDKDKMIYLKQLESVFKNIK